MAKPNLGVVTTGGMGVVSSSCLEQCPMARFWSTFCGHRSPVRVYSEKMHVPSDSFGGRSPEKQACLMLETLLTFVACKIVLAQMQGDGRGDLGSYGGESYRTLVTFMNETPLTGSTRASTWISALLKIDSQVALRILEVRSSYANDDFEWDQLKALTVEGLRKENVHVLRDFMEDRVISSSVDEEE